MATKGTTTASTEGEKKTTGTIAKEVAEFGTFFVFGEILKKIISTIGVAVGEGAANHVKSKLPMFLGLSTEDESIWAALWSRLNPEQQLNLTNFLEGLHDYERNHFRYVVVGISDEEKKIVTGADKDRKETISRKNNALLFLRNLANVIKDKGLDEAKRQCQVGNIMGDSPIAKQAMGKWREGCAWLKTNVLEPLRAVSWKEVAQKTIAFTDTGADKTADALKKTVTNPLQKWIDKQNRSFLAKLLW